ncbi:hypothetical protein QFZ24_005629 [Streptomyces phaeochromogenes]|nr:hypothetical protein [Streptomyces phaeochromogenes]
MTTQTPNKGAAPSTPGGPHGFPVPRTARPRTGPPGFPGQCPGPPAFAQRAARGGGAPQSRGTVTSTDPAEWARVSNRPRPHRTIATTRAP